MAASRSRRPRGKHRVLELEPGILLVFKPAGHVEPSHAHATAQRLWILTGRLAVELARGERRLSAGDSLTIRARARHATRALVDTWLLAIARNTERLDERAGRGKRSRSSRVRQELLPGGQRGAKRKTEPEATRT